MRRSSWFGGSWWRVGLLCAMVVACVAVTGGAASAQAATYTALNAGEWSTCALRTDGSIVCWGRSGQDVPSGNDFTAVSAGGGHGCALRSDGSIVCWGANDFGQATPPAGTDFTAVSAGDYHTCALKRDGSIACWGAGAGSAGDGSGINFGQATPPAGTDFTAVSAGGFHTCALRSDGSIACWGWNFYGQASPPSGTDFTAVSAGDYHACALRTGGAIACWGRINAGTPPARTDFTTVSSGGLHTCALKRDGSIACWGRNASGEASPPAGTDFTAVSAGGSHTCALKRDGSIVCWGDSTYGQTMVPPNQSIWFGSKPPAYPAPGGSYVVSAGASSGLPVSFSIDPSSTSGACSLSGATVSFTGPGSCVIDADQVGDANWNPALQVAQTVTILRPLKVTSLSPTAGPVGGGTQITILGSGFLTGDKVVIAQGSSFNTGAIAATAVSVDSPTQITAITGGPAKPGTWNLFVLAPDGNFAVSPKPFTYAVPRITSISPTSGPAGGGTHITIFGGGFLPGDKVAIDQGEGAGSGAIAATGVSVDSLTQISATTGGPAKPGTWHVFVIGPDGSIATSPWPGFTYTIPTISSISPASGPVGGGTQITLLGSGFLPGDEVVIDQGQGTGITATAVSVDSPTQITATTGGSAKPGAWFVFVIAPDGSIGQAPSLFTYTSSLPPPVTITSVSPTSGPAAGGTRITLHGDGFAAGDRVVIGQGDGVGSREIAATAAVVDSPTEITATTGGPGKPGTWRLYVIAPDGSSFATSPTSFTYTPKVTSVSPTSGPATGGTQITITGLGFTAGDRVVIAQGQGPSSGAIPATVTVDSPTQITATTGGRARPGTFSLFVIAPDGTISKAPTAFTYR